MKFSVVAALLVVLAFAHGTQAGTLVKRDIQAEVDKMTRVLNDMSASLTATTQDMMEKLKALEVTNTAQTYVEEGKTQLMPFVEKLQAEATKIQQQLKPFIADIEEQMKPITENINAKIQPITENFQAQVQPLTQKMEELMQKFIEQTKALTAPQ